MNTTLVTPGGPSGRAPASADVDSLALSFERGFSRGPWPTVGLEEELILIDPESLEPADKIDWVLAMLADDARFKPELRAAQLELVTRVCLTVPEPAASS